MQYPTKRKMVFGCLEDLNAIYGIGDVEEASLVVRATKEGISGTFRQMPYRMKSQIRKWKLVGNSVRALGHQLSLNKGRYSNGK